MPELILAVNAGTSSLKFAVHKRDERLTRVLSGAISAIHGSPRLRLSFEDGEPTVEEPLALVAPDQDGAFQAALQILDEAGLLDRLAAVGHRIVHGGSAFEAPTELTEPVMAALTELAPLAPIHQPVALNLVRAARERLPKARQIGAFDTGFHGRQPRLARLYALPFELSEEGLIGYGFHGLSYSDVASTLAEMEGDKDRSRTIVAHLGSGASLCGMRDGMSIATTMGFSTLDGVPMSTRVGALDPGLVLHLIRARGLGPAAVEELLYRKSGLLGVSGISGDVQVLLTRAEPRAQLAIDLFVYRIVREIGSLAAALGGLDRLVFTGGVGENCPEIRRRVAELCAWLGVQLDLDANAAGSIVIGATDAPVEVLVVPTDEQRAIVRAVAEVLAR